MLEKVEEVVLGLTRLLDSRVFVALGRGLWDFTAKDVYDYVESLQEDRHNKARLFAPLQAGRFPGPAPSQHKTSAAIVSRPYRRISYTMADAHALTEWSALKNYRMMLACHWSCRCNCQQPR